MATQTAVPGTVVSVGSLFSPGGAQGIPGATGPQGPPGPAGAGTGDMLRSVYDTNANNVVDTCDSLAWGKLTSVPSTFTPSAHASTHLSAGSDPIAIATSVLAGLCPAVDNTTIQVVANKLSAVALAWTAITGKPSTFPPDSTAMLKSVYDTNADNIVDHAALADTAPWTGITGKPASFAPSAHASTHNLGGSDAIAPDWTQVQNKPATFAPSAHAASHVTGGSDIIVPASASTAGLLKQLSGNTTDFVDGTNTCQNLVNAVQPTIWSARLRSFNAIGNPTFEVDQRNIGAGQPNIANNAFLQDRWFIQKTGTMSVTGAPAQVPTAGNEIVLPGTNFMITRCYARLSVATAAGLGANDQFTIIQAVEGPRVRELFKDVTSFQILCRSSVANLKFGISFRDPPTATKSLTKLCQLGATPNTWTLITCPNLPAFPSGNFTTAPGSEGARSAICLAAGSSSINTSNDVWNSANVIGALGQDNFVANAAATFDIAYVGWEPGPVCTTLIDLPFTQGYDDCLRYYTKSYPLGVAAGTVTNVGMMMQLCGAGASPTGPVPFKKVMAKTPTATVYSNITGAANSIRDTTANTDKAATGFFGLSDAGFSAITITSPNAAIWTSQYHYTADTGW